MKLKLSEPRTVPLYLIGLLVLLGTGLLVLPALITPGKTGRSGSAAVVPHPAPTWDKLPTRAPAAPAFGAPDLMPLHRALLRGDLDEAAEIWKALLLNFPEASPEMLQAGARLAMMQGRFGTAAERGWRAVGAAPTDARGWSLLGIALRHDGQPAEAEQALAIATELDPTLAPELFNDRWRVALSAGDALTLAELAADYQLRYPGSVWLPYYRAEALIGAGGSLDAIDILVDVLADTPDSPALLWYTLGRAYLARSGYSEAATALEAAAVRTYEGDKSIDMITQDALRDLNTALARSYLGSDRCPEAEMIFRRLAEADPSLSSEIEASVICQTPTPTLTPWIPKQIGTVTPQW